MAQPLLLTVNGTGVPDPFGPGFSSDIGRLITNPWIAILKQFWGPLAGKPYGDFIFWQPVGYPAAVYPMNPSVQAGVAELSRLVTLHEQDGSCPVGWPLYLSGYSQGALVTDTFWRDLVLAPSGLHHNRLSDILDFGGIINFGDPMRCPGISRGNEVAGIAVPGPLDGVLTGGIAGPECLTPEQTPSALLSCNLPGDLYGSAPVGPSSGSAVATGAPWVTEGETGAIETRIFNTVTQGGLLSLVENAKIVAEEFSAPVSTTIGLFQAIYNGLTFAAAGPAAPHWQYAPFVAPMAQWMINRASAFLLQAA